MRVVGTLSGLSCLLIQPAWATANPIAMEDPIELSPEVRPALAQRALEGPIPTVAELEDLAPTDWYYPAVQTLIERYNINLAYPNNTFRGDRALSRDEFANLLAAILEELERRLLAGLDIASELRTVRQLLADAGIAAADLNARLDRLEARNLQLERDRFSATTQLRGQTVFFLTDGTGAPTTVFNRTRLGLNTSFRANDLLVAELEAGTNGLDAINSAQQEDGINRLGTNGVLADGGGLEGVEVDSSLRLRRLHYTWPLARDLEVTVGPKLLPRDWIDRSAYANDSDTNFNHSFFHNNPLIIQNPVDRSGGAGLAIAWNPAAGPFTVRSLYVAADANNPTEAGLFSDPYQGSVELEYRFAANGLVRLQYTHAEVNTTTVDAGGVYGEWLLNPNLVVFGRYGMAHYRGTHTVLNQVDLTPQTWTVGAVFPGALIPGASAGVAIGQPFIEGDLGEANQLNAEAFYHLPLNDRISVTPALSFIKNPDNNSGTVWQGSLRTVFLF